VPRPLSILYEDAEFIAIDKPSGLAVHPFNARGEGSPALRPKPHAGGADGEPTALHLVRDAVGHWVYPVHRLDRGTSGVLIFARDPASARLLHELFEDGRAEKTYLALVRGVAPDEGLIDHPIPRKEGGPRVPASTSFRRVWQGNHLSLVEARPKTGRFHQVRRHLKHIHHPLIGDANYGKGALNREYRERFGLARLALHAKRLVFEKPLSGERICLEAPLPEDLRVPFERIGVVI